MFLLLALEVDKFRERLNYGVEHYTKPQIAATMICLILKLILKKYETFLVDLKIRTHG
jgi:hypothetical protein